MFSNYPIHKVRFGFQSTGEAAVFQWVFRTGDEDNTEIPPENCFFARKYMTRCITDMCQNDTVVMFEEQ